MDYEKLSLIEDLWVEPPPPPPASKKLKLGKDKKKSEVYESGLMSCMPLFSGVVILGVLLCCSILVNIYVMNLRYQERNIEQAKPNVMAPQSCNISSIVESLHQTDCDLKCTQIHGFGGLHCMPKTSNKKPIFKAFPLDNEPDK